MRLLLPERGADVAGAVVEEGADDVVGDGRDLPVLGACSGVRSAGVGRDPLVALRADVEVSRVVDLDDGGEELDVLLRARELPDVLPFPERPLLAPRRLADRDAFRFQLELALRVEVEFRVAPVLLDVAVPDADDIAFGELREGVRLLVPERDPYLACLVADEEAADLALPILLIEFADLELPRDAAGDGDGAHPGVEVLDLRLARLLDQLDAELVRDDVRGSLLADEAR